MSATRSQWHAIIVEGKTSDCIESLLGSILQGPPPMISPLSDTKATLRYQDVDTLSPTLHGRQLCPQLGNNPDSGIDLDGDNASDPGNFSSECSKSKIVVCGDTAVRLTSRARAAAYAAVYPRQLDSLNNMVSCLTNGLCDSNNKCCTGLQCVPIGEYHVWVTVAPGFICLQSSPLYSPLDGQ
ncbi:hypothetical protein BJV77DRAFT_965363 [Russula vinacea]|nr:hypothetical protein BJV77DRAFT_965363 [Russula vinacea]